MLFVLLLLSIAFVSYTNGANANFKGVASLYGSGTTSRWVALLWGTATTFAGSLASAVIAHGLLQKFSGRGLVSDSLISSPVFMAGVAMGAASTSYLATRWGFPVSTTHCLVGALTGAGFVASDEVHWHSLGKNFIIPLLFSPILAALLGGLLYPLLRGLRLAPEHRTWWLDPLHFVSTGAASFARGLNDTPKVASLLMAAPLINSNIGLIAVAVLIAVGGLLDSRNVAETLAHKITGMNPGQGFAASIVTAALVGTASWHSLPVSTTHVSVGSLLGMGAVTGQARWKNIVEILLAWVCTVPCAALLAMLGYALAGGVRAIS